MSRKLCSQFLSQFKIISIHFYIESLKSKLALAVAVGASVIVLDLVGSAIWRLLKKKRLSAPKKFVKSKVLSLPLTYNYYYYL